MSYSQRFMSWLNRTPLAESATLTVITGTRCPCMISRDANNPSYSEEWHRVNSGQTDCLGLGIISTTTTSTTIKAIFSPPRLMGSAVPQGTVILEQIGELSDEDLIMWGIVNTTTLAAVDVSSYNEYTSYITKNSIKYTIRDVFDLPGDVGQVAVLVRRNT